MQAVPGGFNDGERYLEGGMMYDVGDMNGLVYREIITEEFTQ